MLTSQPPFNIRHLRTAPAFCQELLTDPFCRYSKGQFGPYQSEVAWPVLYIDVAKNFECQIRKNVVIVGNQKRTCKLNVRVKGTFAPSFR